MNRGIGSSVFLKNDDNPKDRRTNKARNVSDTIYGMIERERLKKLNAQNPKKAELGPYAEIINYIDFMHLGGIEVSDDDIIKYIQKKMPRLDTDDIQRLINKARALKIIAYYKYRYGKTSQAIEDAVREFQNIDKLRIAKIIQRYRINPDCLSKLEEAEVEKWRQEIAKREQAEKGQKDSEVR